MQPDVKKRFRDETILPFANRNLDRFQSQPKLDRQDTTRKKYKFDGHFTAGSNEPTSLDTNPAKTLAHALPELDTLADLKPPTQRTFLLTNLVSDGVTESKSRSEMTEQYSGLLLTSRLVSSASLKLALANMKYFPLARFSQLGQARSKNVSKAGKSNSRDAPTISANQEAQLESELWSSDWVTIAVLGKKCDVKASNYEAPSAIWNLYNLKKTSIQLHLKNESFETHGNNVEIGSVLLLLNPQIDLSQGKGDGGIIFRVTLASQLVNLGVSADYGVCPIPLKENRTCGAVINKNNGRCEFHLINRFNEKRSERSVIANSSAGNKLQGLTMQSINLSRNSALYDRNAKKLAIAKPDVPKLINPAEKKKLVEKNSESLEKSPVIKNPIGVGQGARFVKAVQGVSNS